MDYSFLLNTACASRWQKVGTKRRAGIAVPLFSVYSKESIGIGDFLDLKYLVDWCCKTGLSVLQLLPLNEVGTDFAPYNAISTFALEPSYINLNAVKGIYLNHFEADIKNLRKKFPQRKQRVNYAIKSAKLDVLWNMYLSVKSTSNPEFDEFCRYNSYWLIDFALFKTLSEELNEGEWEKWDDKFKNREAEAITAFAKKCECRIEFHKWVQYQLWLQLIDAKRYAEKNSVLIMGDLPFLVSRNSADVWAHTDYFRLELSAGAPPDMYFALGQKWGMPPYNWYKIADDGFCYLDERLRFASSFYDMYRIDHFVGLFRVWTIPAFAPPEQAAAMGKYEPQDEGIWEEHGKAILNAMLNASEMMPCAEDLGTVPYASYKVLGEYGIMGIEFQRYLKDQSQNFGFKQTWDYRSNSVSVLSTHDSSFFFNWWKTEAGTMDEKLFELLCKASGFDENKAAELKKMLFNKKLSGRGRVYWNEEISSREQLMSIAQMTGDASNSLGYAYLESYAEKQKFLNYLGNDSHFSAMGDFIYRTLLKVNEASSIFSIQLLQEYLALDEELFAKMNRWDYRINTPGSFNRRNWSLLLPCQLEELQSLSTNEKIKNILKQTNRLS